MFPNGSQTSSTAKTVRMMARIAVLKLPILSAMKPGSQRPNTEPRLSIGRTRHENVGEKPWARL